MAKLIVTAQVKDPAKWEQSFRTHGEMFKRYGVKGPILIGVNENNEVAVLEEVADVNAIMSTLSSTENVQAMEADGVKTDSVKVFVLDKEFSF